MGISMDDYRRMVGRTSADRPVALIGIDPGVKTGWAVYHTLQNKLVDVSSTGIIRAMEWVMDARHSYADVDAKIHVYVEDTRKLRLPKAMRSEGRERGAGSVARDMSIWSEFLQHHDIPHTMCGLSPAIFRAKGNAEWFRQHTGWTKKTNEHGRAAAGLVWGK